MSEKDRLEKGIHALKAAMEAKGVKVDTKLLTDAVHEAHKSVIAADCEGCANGWHW
jgi:hypothetical protein